MAHNNRKQRLYPAGEGGSSQHRDKYADRTDQSTAKSATPTKHIEPGTPLALWRPIDLTSQNRAALEAINRTLQPVIEESGEAIFEDPETLRFKILGASAIQRAMYLTKIHSTEAFCSAIKQRLSRTAGEGLVTTTTTVRAIRPNEHRPMYIHVGIEGIPHDEMRTAAETLNSVYGRKILNNRPFASFGIASIEDPSETPDQLTTRLSGIDFGDVFLGAVEVPPEYQPLY